MPTPPNPPVASSNTAGQDLTFILKRKRKSIDLQLRHELERSALGQAQTALAKRTQFIDVVAIVERKHWASMGNFWEIFRRTSAHALRGAVRSYMFGVFILQFLETLK